MLKRLRQLESRYRRLAHARRVAAIEDVLSRPGIPDTRRSQEAFETLQDAYPGLPEYGYDLENLFLRAASRSATILKRAGAGDRKLRILELGAGDGMLGALLAAAGHEVVLCDLEDWRTASARHLRFVAADCSERIPLETGTFDVVCSFNSFEHFGDPLRAFEEAHRITRRDGLMHFDFGPLFCSPWGLHAYRSLRMPYSQFLFSEEFVKRKLAEIGIWDLGKERVELQRLNKWRAAQFIALWSGEDCGVIKSQQHVVEDHLDVVRRFPEAFRGRSLTFTDVTCANLIVTVRKTEEVGAGNAPASADREPAAAE
jgi:SAM-dependent methyltransferase